MSTIAEVLEKRRNLMLAQDVKGLADLFAPDGVIELPFAGEVAPARVEGRDAIRELSAAQDTGLVKIDSLQDVEVHQTADPEVVVVESRTKATVTASGQSIETASIHVFRIRDGQIVLERDYVNLAALTEAFAG